MLGDVREFAGKEGVQITAENSFFHQRSDKHSHGHEQHGAAPALEKLLDGNVIHVLDARTGQRHENGKAATGEEIHPRAAFANRRISA